MTAELVQLHNLQLVYPPISNQEAEWLRSETEAREVLAPSKLYMIATRAEAKFVQFGVEEETGLVHAKFAVPGLAEAPFAIDFPSTLLRKKKEDSRFDLEIGPKVIRATEIDDAGNKLDVLDWFTTEKLLYNRWRNHPEVLGLDAFRDFSTYELLYVGISNEQGAFTRLVEHAHEKRVRILTNEFPQAPGARVSDEVYFFFFDISPLHVQISTFEEFQLLESSKTLDKARMIADAEKAFTHVLQAKYNTVLFSGYPRGQDGLYGQGLTRYGYIVDEDITFRTSKATIRGTYNALERPDSATDLISIAGETVELVKADAASKP